MLQITRALKVATVLCLAALLPLAHGQVASVVVKMNPKPVAVSSLNSLSRSVDPMLFSGQAVVYSRLATDPISRSPTLVMLIDMSGVIGVSKSSGLTYVSSSQEYIVRPHLPNQSIEFTFALATGASAPISAVRTGTAQFAMNVDPVTGSITSVAASVTPR